MKCDVLGVGKVHNRWSMVGRQQYLISQDTGRPDFIHYKKLFPSQRCCFALGLFQSPTQQPCQVTQPRNSHICLVCYKAQRLQHHLCGIRWFENKLG